MINTLLLQYIPRNMHTVFALVLLCCGYTLTDFPISIRLTSLALWQSNDCPSASKATLVNMDKYFMWIHYERLHNHNKAKHNKTVCIFLVIYCRILLAIGISFKHHFDTKYWAFCNPSPHRMFLPLDLPAEYRLQHSNIGPLYITFRYSHRIFYSEVSWFAAFCPCGVWCRGLTTCLLCVSPLFGNQVLNNNWAVGLIKWIVNLHLFCLLTYAIVQVLKHHIIYRLYHNILVFFIFDQVLMY